MKIRISIMVACAMFVAGCRTMEPPMTAGAEPPRTSEALPPPPPEEAVPPPPPPPPPPAPVPTAPMLPPPVPTTPLPIADANYVKVPVYYATNRQKLSDTDLEGRFANASGNGVIYGGLEVTIPIIHQAGEVERPGLFYGIFFDPDPAKHFTIAFNREYDRAGFLTRVRQSLQSHAGIGRKQVLVFVHGFNVSFDEAAFRTAQISHDTEFKGTTLFYSWPSARKMSLLGYTADSSRIRETEPYLKAFFADIATETSADDIFVIAHSMGTQGVSEALKDLAIESPDKARRIRALILAAPDVNKKIFIEQIAPAIRNSITNVTVYASGEDKALKFSKELSDAERLGDTGVGIAVLPGVNSIDATAANTSWLGHSEYGSNPLLLRDIRSIIDGKTPAQRSWLTRKTAASLPYYVFRAPPP
jgi:esterase/lipase superfamily enzyme